MLHASACRRGSGGGFTLIEMTVTVAVLTILALVALPNLSGSVAMSRLTVLATEFASSADFARSEAMRRKSPVVMCPRLSGGVCAGSASNWNGGWILFVDANGDDALSGGESIVMEHGSLADGLSAGAGAAASLVFIANGELVGLGGGSRTVSMTSGSMQRNVVLRRNGKARVETY